MSKVLAIVLRLFLLFLIIVICAFNLSSEESLKIYSAIGIALILLLSGLTAGFKAGGLFGFLIVFTPLLGRGSFHLAWSCFLLGQFLGDLFESDGFDPSRPRAHDNSAKEVLLLALLSFSTIFCLGLIIPFRVDFDLSTTLDILRNGGILGLRQYWSTLTSSSARALMTFCGYLLIFLQVSALAGSLELNSDLKRLIKGICLGLVASIGVLVAQTRGADGFFAGNYTEYWRLLKQYPAASTDPNALSVLAALIFPMIAVVYTSKRLVLILLISLFTLGLYSGSRTFLLALFLVGGALTYIWVKRFGRKELNWAFGVGLFGVIFAVLLLGQPAVNSQLQKVLPFPASVRVLKSIHWEERSSMFASRAIFSKVAIRTWQQSPIIGVGLERFYDHEKVAMEQLGIDLGGFVDNANNFYLQVLSECGILGISLFLISLSLLALILFSPSLEELNTDEIKTVSPPGSKIELKGSRTLKSFEVPSDYPSVEVQARARLSLGIFILLLLTGSHLLSAEVQLATSILLAAAFCRPVLIRKVVLSQIRMSVIGCLFVFTLGNLVLSSRTFPSTRSSGFYPPDSAALPFLRWSGSKARIVICNNAKDTVEIKFRSLKPGSEKRPVSVKFHEGDIDLGDTTQNFELTNTEWTTAIINLRPDANGGFSNAVVNLAATPVWSPSALKTSPDPRWLGVLVELPEGSC